MKIKDVVKSKEPDNIITKENFEKKFLDTAKKHIKNDKSDREFTVLLPVNEAIDGNILNELSKNEETFSEFVKNHIAITRVSQNKIGVVVTEANGVLTFDKKSNSIIMDGSTISVGKESKLDGEDERVYISRVNPFIPSY